MRSFRLSTKLPKTNLAIIFKYGVEALSNRRKDLLLITFMFIMLPQILAFFMWNMTASEATLSLGSLTQIKLIDQIETFFAAISSRVLGWAIISGGLGVVGILTLARTSVDYFESRPGPVFDVTKRALRVLLTKGPGALLLLILVMPVLVLMPLLRAVAMSMLVMLPVTLVAGAGGGFRTAWDTLFLKYANRTDFGRWPVFINVLSVTGIFLTVFFAVSMGIETLAVLDTIFGIPAGILATDFHVAQFSVNGGRFISAAVGILWESLAIAVIVPFTAATYHLSTVPDGHVDFETTV